MVSTRSTSAKALTPTPPAAAKKGTPKKATPRKEQTQKTPSRTKKGKKDPPISPATAPSTSSPRQVKGEKDEENKPLQDKDDKGEGKQPVVTSPTTLVDPAEFEYEFGGPLGALCVIVFLPVVIYALYFLCNKDYCLTNSEILEFDFAVLQKTLPSVEDLLDDQAAYAVLGWMAFHILLERTLPGEIAYGTQLVTGEKLAYTLSGHLQFWVTLAVIYFGVVKYSFSLKENTVMVNGFSPLPLAFIYDHYLGLITASTIFSALLSVFVYLKSFTPGALLAQGGVSGNIVYDFFIGRELNPRIGSHDIKEFCELRPGLIGWFVINLGMAVKQLENTGSMSLSMLLINAFQGFYVWDALHAEKSILSTMDITTDGFGFMLAFGDLAWVPFIYSLQARYLVDYDPHLDVYTIGAIVLLQCFGYYVFRAANSEKDAFRRNPDDPRVRYLTYLQTKRGTRLITSGWWGSARKINYTGDWIMTFSWCLLCGWQSPIPYFQAVYFLILLVHRAIRDDKMCHEKYGDDWVEYKRRVPYVFIPYVI